MPASSIMYHSRKFSITVLCACSLSYTAGLGALSVEARAEASSLTTQSRRLESSVAVASGNFPLVPPKKQLKRKPTRVSIYQYDEEPIGDKQPFLFVHGLRGEYHPGFRWGQVVKKFRENAEFKNKYKIYYVRYDTTAPLSVTVPQFRDAINELYRATANRPITSMALSMGGNVVYESMLDKQTDSQIRLLLALGTPFHGSPLFSMDWLQYGVYKNFALPWTRVDHSLSYRLYFKRNPTLMNDLRWDNSDNAIPDVGRYKSLLPFGPKGDLTVARCANDRLLALNKQPFDKKKLIAYSGYLLNEYMLPGVYRYLDIALMAPYTMLTVKVPSHLAREHPVLRMLNKEISTVVPAKNVAKKADSNFIYSLNDGITPVSSALFVPMKLAASVPLTKEEDLPRVKDVLDVRVARVFRNIDHLTFIDGFRPLNASSGLRDELAPHAGTKDIFEWMVTDILKADEADSKIAREAPVEAAPHAPN